MIFETIGRSLVLVLLMAMTFQADAVVGASGGAPQDGVSEQTARGKRDTRAAYPDRGSGPQQLPA